MYILYVCVYIYICIHKSLLTHGGRTLLRKKKEESETYEIAYESWRTFIVRYGVFVSSKLDATITLVLLHVQL